MNKKKLLNFAYILCGLAVFVGIFFDLDVLLVGIPALFMLAVYIVQLFWEAKGTLKQRVAKISVTTLTYFLVVILLLWVQFSVFVRYMGEDFYDLLYRQTNVYKLILLSGWVIFCIVICVFASLVVEGLLSYFAGDKVEKQYQRLIEAAPQNCENYQRLGEYYRAEERYDAAENILRKAISIDPENNQNYLYLGYALIGGGKYEAAENVYRQAIKINPNNSKAYLCLAVALHEYLERPDEDEIEKMYRKAIELNPHEAVSCFQLGWFLLDRKKCYEEAESMFLMTLELDPDEATALYNLACIKSKFKEQEATFHYLRQAIEKGFDKEWAWTDPDLEWIRSDERFAEVVGLRSMA